MLSVFKNLQIKYKVSFAPLVAVLFLMFIGFEIKVLMHNQKDSITDNNTAFHKSEIARDIESKLESINGNLYKIISWASNSSDATDVMAKSSANVAASVKQINVDLQEMLSMNLNEEETKTVKNMQTKLASYKKEVDNTLSMANVDITTTFMFIGSVDAAYDALKKDVDSFCGIQKDFSKDAFQSTIDNTIKTGEFMDRITVLALVLQVLVTVVAVRMITKPITQMTHAMGQIAGGNLSIIVPATDQKDEIGEMASAVQVFKENAQEVRKMHEEQIATREKHEQEKRATLNNMANEFEQQVAGAIENVSNSTDDMNKVSDMLNTIAIDVADKTKEASNATSNIASNISNVAGAVEELSTSIKEIGEQVSIAADISKNAVSEVHKADERIRGLSEAAGKIDNIVSLINDIASQTNLLALNATIEAARAGDMGKGFAVVAHEVKSLATQTASATDEIAKQIHEVQNSTNMSVEAIASITKIIGQISEISINIASAIEQQDAASMLISNNTQTVAVDISAVASNVMRANEAGDDVRNVAQSVIEQVLALSDGTKMLQDKLNGFVRKIKA